MSNDNREMYDPPKIPMSQRERAKAHIQEIRNAHDMTPTPKGTGDPARRDPN